MISRPQFQRVPPGGDGRGKIIFLLAKQRQIGVDFDRLRRQPRRLAQQRCRRRRIACAVQRQRPLRHHQRVSHRAAPP
jgi:hypothetical protein